ncbi:divergent polysaccharide deacetylase family protein [Pseudomonadota bacterium]
MKLPFTINVSALTGVFSRLNPKAVLDQVKAKFKKGEDDDEDVLGDLGDLDQLDAEAAAAREDGDDATDLEDADLGDEEAPDTADELDEMSMDSLEGEDEDAGSEAVGGEGGGDAEQEALDALADMPDFDTPEDDEGEDEDDEETKAKKKRVLMLAGGGVAAAVVLGAVAFLLMGGEPEPDPQQTAGAGLGLIDLPEAPVHPDDDQPFTTAPTTTSGALSPPPSSPDLPTSGLKLGGPSVLGSEAQRLLDLGLDFQQEPGTGVVIPSVTKASFPELSVWPQEAALEAAPLDILLEQAEQGMLPKIAQDGYTPFDAYARPEPRGDAGLPKVAIVLTGMGTSRPATEAALKGVPADVTIALDVYARGLDFWVKKARDDGHEVLLTLPLESKNFPFDDPGPAQLRALVSPAENVVKLEWVLARTSGYFGVFADFGTKFLTVDEQVSSVIEQLQSRGLMYVDGGAVGSLGSRVAFKAKTPWAAVEIRLDGEESTQAIDAKLAELEALAKKRAQTVARIGNSPLALQRLGLWLKGLEQRGLRLVPVSALANKQLVR